MSEQFAIISAKALRDTRLSNLQIRILAVLSTFANKEGRCCVLQETLAGYCNCTREAVSRNFETLKDLGYIEIIRNRGASTYFVNYDFRRDSRVTTDVIPESQQMCAENHNRCDSRVTYNNNIYQYVSNKEKKEKEKEKCAPVCENLKPVPEESPVTEADIERWQEVEREMQEVFTKSEMAWIHSLEIFKDDRFFVCIPTRFIKDRLSGFDFESRFAALESVRGLEYQIINGYVGLPEENRVNNFLMEA